MNVVHRTGEEAHDGKQPVSLCSVPRLKESDLKTPLEKAAEVAKKTERELFHYYKDTDSKYKSKYRSLMFNLKDTKNNVSTLRLARCAFRLIAVLLTLTRVRRGRAEGSRG